MAIESTVYERINDYGSVKITLASPNDIRSWSFGEVRKPETINYRTYRAERDGLFCERIFGPERDWECFCGKYKGTKHKGMICDRCGVKVTHSRVRRKRMGHINLAAPVVHIWFFKAMPSRLGTLLDMKVSDLEKVIYFQDYIVVDAGPTPLKERQLLTEEEYRGAREKYGTEFDADMGAEAVKKMLQRIDMAKLSQRLREELGTTRSKQKVKNITKRLKLVEALRESGNQPEWMVLDVIPVIPPDLRPLVLLDSGNFATSDLNDLYRRIMNRNNRLKKLVDLNAPEVIIRNEKRMLQAAVDALFDNARCRRPVLGSSNRPLKSLTDMIKGKQGRFRENLLGKRVDYSARSVIVIGPELKLHQAGLPKKIALELFQPFIIRRLKELGYADTIKSAKRMIERQDREVWDILDEVTHQHPVLLNRAPTLHRMGIQAFEPVLIEGNAIKIHPLVCRGFNADFDGDQMAVHIPLSPEAQIEASVLMLSSHNILSPANGQALAVPTQDMVLGIYYMTKARHGTKGEGRTFANVDEVVLALEMGEVETLSPIRLRYSGKVADLTKARDNQDLLHAEPVTFRNQYIETTVGRVILNDHLPQQMPYVNGLLKKKGIGQLVQYCYLHFGLETTVQMLDEIKNLGFLYATRAGISIGIDDLVIPVNKQELVRKAEKEVISVQQQYMDGAITNGERYNKVIGIWSNITEQVADEMFRAMEEEDKKGEHFNPIYIMADSGARGSKQQIRQLSGMRGLMAKPSGEIIETPITANFREGLTVLQYFISTHGARKGLADTALKTADSGYLTRRLVDVAQDVIISMQDCGTSDGIFAEPIYESGEIIEPLRDRIVGRVSLEQIKDYEGNIIAEVNQVIDEELANAIEAVGIERVKIRSVLTCEARRGVCVMCYGRNLAGGRLVEMGEAVGVIAAQSIGEPGTQLTMRTFHIGGTATRVSEQSTQDAKNNGFAKFVNLNTVRSKDGALIVMNRNGAIAIVDEKGREKEHYSIVYGARLKVEEGQPVTVSQILVEWDPYTFSILTEAGGTVQFKDLHEGVTLHEEVDEITGLSRRVVTDSPDEKLQPTVAIRDEKHKVSRKYLMPSRAHLMVEDGDQVFPGDVLAKMPRETTKTKDITGGLPRVVELFEARRPKDPAVISEVDGMVKYGDLTKGQRKILVSAEDSSEREYLLPRGVHIRVQEGDRVRAGEPLMDGPLNPHDILSVLGEKKTQDYLVNEIQEVYRLQGVNINDKHIEVIVRQMMRWVKVEEVGDSEFLLEEMVDKFKFADENERVVARDGKPAVGRPLLMGITKASLSTDSFISAASFQETTRVLTEAAISGKVDYLRGLKENVIMGRLIPAGTGMGYYRNLRLSTDAVAEAEAALAAATPPEEARPTPGDFLLEDAEEEQPTM